MSSLRQCKSQLGVEQLERREVLSTASFSGGVLTITGTDAADVIEVRAWYDIDWWGQVRKYLYVSGTPIDLGGGQLTGSVPIASVSNIRVDARGGDDTIRLDTENTTGWWDGLTMPATVRGQAGNDVIVAGKANDRVYGGEGNDVILGNDGADYLSGEAGDDVLQGGNGNDELFGGIGNDRLYGQGGSDWLWGAAGSDVLDGGTSIDFAWGGTGPDSFHNLADVYKGEGFFSPTTHQYAQHPGVQDYNYWEGDRLR